MSLIIKDLYAKVAGGGEILRGLNLEIEKGRVHAVMGPNGSGKSTLSKVISGHPDYEITGGDILMDGVSLVGMEPDERARAGVFMAFQYPVEIPGVSNANFIRAALQARLSEGEEFEATAFYGDLYREMDALEIPRTFTSRSVNEGFSGGEKKRNEVLQMAMLKPRYAILDETDSGLDIDALKTVSAGVNAQRGPSVGMLVITHYQRLLDYIQPDVVHVLVGGRIVRTGPPSLALELEERGYDWIREEVGQSACELAGV
jgi:Fe-S cluster assembly ATP-binding protein